MITANLPKDAKTKITRNYVRRLEKENETLLRRIVAMRDAIVTYKGAIKMYPKHSYEVEQAQENLDRAIESSPTGGR